MEDLIYKKSHLDEFYPDNKDDREYERRRLNRLINDDFRLLLNLVQEYEMHFEHLVNYQLEQEKNPSKSLNLNQEWLSQMADFHKTSFFMKSFHSKPKLNKIIQEMESKEDEEEEDERK